ncbi:hypothetical protein [Luteithermobacter gelatinilyticus]|uniref:hypothetical protein n=1 Tax=Luteithermobacter gelatinilyticus TaxID=2582913 RepID=UPI001105BEE7|nr:hypothetical protein [Luteithermobacter gelatinilyticus]
MVRDKTSPSSSEELDQLAEQYLDFWQENLANWATDPQALEKWVEALSSLSPSSSRKPSQESPDKT